MKMFKGLAVVALITAVGIGSHGCSDDDDNDGTPGPGSGSSTIVPASWGGTWEVESNESQRRGSQTEYSVDVICSGIDALDAFNLLDDEDYTDVSCTGSITDNAVDITCTGSRVIQIPRDGEPCTVTSTANFTGTKSGDEVMGTITIQNELEGNCGGQTNSTITIDIDATRVSNDQLGCGDFEEFVTTGMQGIWDTTLNDADCETGVEGKGTMDFQLGACQGWSVEDFILQNFFFSRRDEIGSLGEIDVEYTGGFTETSIEIHADVDVIFLDEGCPSTTQIQVDLQRTGEDVSGYFKISDTYYGKGCPSGTCSRYNVTGSRVSTVCF